MNKNLFSKILAITIIVSFIGILPSVNGLIFQFFNINNSNDKLLKNHIK